MGSAAARAGAGWLFGPVPDLLLGCGGLYVAIVLGISLGGEAVRAAQPQWLAPLLVLIVGAPHYGATLLRVYEKRADRQAYTLFAVYATLAVAAAFGVALFDFRTAAVLVTLYLTWSPWHYSGQNYGLALLFLRRAGVPVPLAAKRLLYVSFLASFALTVLVFHGADSAPEPEYAEGAPALFLSLGIPAAFSAIAFPICFAVYAFSLLGSIGWIARGAPLRALVPALAMVALQSLWFAVPFVIRHWSLTPGFEPFDWSLRPYYFFWIAVAHSAQYCWVTTYFARRSPEWRARGGYGRYLAKILVAGTAVWTFPAILLDPNRVGVLPNTATLSVLVAAAVNLHHFILDGAIWKLRDGRIARVLVRKPVGGDAAPIGPGGGWGRRAVWSFAAVAFALAVFKYSHEDVLFPRAIQRGDYDAARAVLDRMQLLMRIPDEARDRIGRIEEHQRKRRAALDRRMERRVGVIPDVSAHRKRGAAHAAKGQWPEALAAYQTGLELDPTNLVLLRGAAGAWLALSEPARAETLLARAVDLAPWDEASRRELQRARRAVAAAAR